MIAERDCAPWGARFDNQQNQGDSRCLYFTTIGPAVNQVTRLEGLCKSLGTPLVVSEGFAADYAEELLSLGTHRLASMDHEIEIYTLPGLTS